MGEISLEKIVKDMEFLKVKIEEIDEKIETLIAEKYEVRDEYVEKIKKILEEGEFEEFSDIETLKKSIDMN